MILRFCRDCATTFVVALSRCPRCKSTNYQEGAAMPKVSRHQGASYKDRIRVGEVAKAPTALPDPKPVEVIEPEPVIEPETEPVEPEPVIDMGVFTAIDIEVAAEVTKAKPPARKRR